MKYNYKKLISINNFHNGLKKTYIQFKNYREEKKLNAEVPKLIDSLISYMNAGLHPYRALEISSQKQIFSKTLRFPLYKITTLCSRGSSFVDAIDIVNRDIILKSSHKYLVHLFIGLKISFLKGARSLPILEKIREKTLDEIQFQRKLNVITAQMRFQAHVILFSPFLLSMILFFISPEHIFIFFESFFGKCIFFLMIVLNLSGYFTIRNILKIE